MTQACHCNEFSRATLLRGAAIPGAGLPAIERGMPAPAGTGLSRRSFLNRSAGMALAVYGGAMLAPRAFEEGIASAAAATPDQRILVSVFLPGGIDALSLLAPTGHSDYATLRPSLAIAPDAADQLIGDSTLQWHPNARPLRDLHAAGKLTVLPAIGYTDPNQSHFTSRHYWEVGELNPAGRVGWMGRFLDRHGAPDNPLQGLSLDYNLAPSLAPSSVPVAAVSAPEDYDFWTRDVWDDAINDKLLTGFGTLGNLVTDDAELGAARGAARMSAALRNGLLPVHGMDPMAAAQAAYPAGNDAFPRRLATLAEMIARGLPLRCVALEANGGYDTHDDQNGSLPDNIALLSQSLAAFQADLDARNLSDRVIVHVWSEFGRRAEENGGGTDHGAGGVSLIMGAQAAGGIVGEFPGIASSELDEGGNLQHTTDFRAVYKTLVEGWFEQDATGIVPDAAAFSALPLLK
ncbi:MAG: hypothetical protein QOI80_1147 [Solirubrobacteraceae bacterium]|jgi:uncharacterized protein (DUF1501 family)|nr:hypothetical protein [Solirubrobacteraceae bacterium]